MLIMVMNTNYFMEIYEATFRKYSASHNKMVLTVAVYEKILKSVIKCMKRMQHLLQGIIKSKLQMAL